MTPSFAERIAAPARDPICAAPLGQLDDPRIAAGHRPVSPNKFFARRLGTDGVEKRRRGGGNFDTADVKR